MMLGGNWGVLKLVLGEVNVLQLLQLSRKANLQKTKITQGMTSEKNGTNMVIWSAASLIHRVKPDEDRVNNANPIVSQNMFISLFNVCHCTYSMLRRTTATWPANAFLVHFSLKFYLVY